jgi:hypothetical protein
MKGRRDGRNIKGKISYFPVFVIISFNDDNNNNKNNNNNEVKLFLCLIKPRQWRRGGSGGVAPRVLNQGTGWR